LGMRIYFAPHDYTMNIKARVAIYNLIGKASLLLEQCNEVKKHNEKRIEWKQFKRYFKKKYVSKQFYERKFHEV